MTLDFYLTRGMIERAALELGPTPYQETAAVSVWLALAGHGRRPIPKTNGTTVGLPRQCEIRVVLTRVFSRPKISAWVPQALFLASRISGSCPGPLGRGRHPGPLDLGILPGDVAGSPGDLEEDPACGPGRGIVERVTLELDLAPQED